MGLLPSAHKHPPMAQLSPQLLRPCLLRHRRLGSAPPSLEAAPAPQPSARTHCSHWGWRRRPHGAPHPRGAFLILSLLAACGHSPLAVAPTQLALRTPPAGCLPSAPATDWSFLLSFPRRFLLCLPWSVPCHAVCPCPLSPGALATVRPPRRMGRRAGRAVDA